MPAIHRGDARARRCARKQPARARQAPGHVSEQDIVELNIPTGIPLVYELNDDLTPIRKYYLGDAEAARRAAAGVAAQVKG